MRSTPRRRLLPGLFVASLIAATVAPLWSQSQLLPHEPGVWKPWKGLTASPSARATAGVTAVQVKAFEAELLALNAILKRAAGVAVPVGFSVETWGNLSSGAAPTHAPGHPGAKALPIAGGFSFGAFPIFQYQRNGTMVREDTGETALQQFRINDLGRDVFDTRHIGDFGAVDHDAFLKPASGAAIAGWPRYGDTLVIAKDPERLWTPLTLGAALDIVMQQRRAEVAEFQKSVDAFTANLAKVRDPARKAARLKEAREAAAGMPNPAAFMAAIEQALQIEEATIEKELSPTGATAKGLADAQRSLDDATSWLAELSADDRDGPSCWAGQGPTLRARVRPVPNPGCVPLVRPNYAYFDPTLPRSAPQVVVITGIARCFDTADRNNRDATGPGPHGCAANRALIETMDQTAIRAWLR